MLHTLFVVENATRATEHKNANEGTNVECQIFHSVGSASLGSDCNGLYVVVQSIFSLGRPFHKGRDNSQSRLRTVRSLYSFLQRGHKRFDSQHIYRKNARLRYST